MAKIYGTYFLRIEGDSIKRAISNHDEGWEDLAQAIREAPEQARPGRRWEIIDRKGNPHHSSFRPVPNCEHCHGTGKDMTAEEDWLRMYAEEKVDG